MRTKECTSKAPLHGRPARGTHTLEPSQAQLRPHAHHSGSRGLRPAS